MKTDSSGKKVVSQSYLSVRFSTGICIIMFIGVVFFASATIMSYLTNELLPITIVFLIFFVLDVLLLIIMRCNTLSFSPEWDYFTYGRKRIIKIPYSECLILEISDSMVRLAFPARKRFFRYIDSVTLINHMVNYDLFIGVLIQHHVQESTDSKTRNSYVVQTRKEVVYLFRFCAVWSPLFWLFVFTVSSKYDDIDNIILTFFFVAITIIGPIVLLLLFRRKIVLFKNSNTLQLCNGGMLLTVSATDIKEIKIHPSSYTITLKYTVCDTQKRFRVYYANNNTAAHKLLWLFRVVNKQ